MHCVNLLGQHLSARHFDRQVAECQVLAAILNTCTALGISGNGRLSTTTNALTQPWAGSHQCWPIGREMTSTDPSSRSNEYQNFARSCPTDGE